VCSTKIRGKVKDTEGISAEIVQDVIDGDYKYLSMLEADQIKPDEMNNRVQTEYFRQVKRVLRSKLSGSNTVSAINIWVMSFTVVTVLCTSPLQGWLAGIWDAN